MKVIDAGHMYELDELDITETKMMFDNGLRFVKRMGDKYPGNTTGYAGTTIQEVCRALIDRCQYVNGQEYCGETAACITYLRRVIVELETRAAKRHGRKVQLAFDIENMPTCRLCGHIGCEETCRKKKCKHCSSEDHLTAEHPVGGMMP